MNNADDDNSSGRPPPDPGGAAADRGSAVAAPGGSKSREPRKPRIEVLRAGPTSASQLDGTTTQRDDSTLLRGAAGGATRAHSPKVASGYSQQAETLARRRGRPSFRSPTMLLALLALAVIAGALWYTYAQSERDRDYADREEAVRSVVGERSASPQGDETPVASEPTLDSPAAQPPPLQRPSPAEPREAAASDGPDQTIARSATGGEDTSALTTVRAFYAALSAGDGASAAQLVIPAKRQSGPLSARELSRYFSSFRRPLRVRRVTPVDDNTVQVAYDYVLADGRLCEGVASVDVVQSGDRRMVSGIRTRGPC